MSVIKFAGRCAAVVAAVGMTGCGTPIGPFSYMAVKRNDNMQAQRLQRSVLMREDMALEKRQRIIEAVNLGATPGEVAMGFQLNVTEFINTDKTWGEIGLEAAGSLADVGLYAGLISLIDKELDKSDSSDDKPKAAAGSTTIVLENVNAPVNIGTVTGDNNASNNDDNGTGTSNKDIEGL